MGGDYNGTMLKRGTLTNITWAVLAADKFGDEDGRVLKNMAHSYNHVRAVVDKELVIKGKRRELETHQDQVAKIKNL